MLAMNIVKTDTYGAITVKHEVVYDPQEFETWINKVYYKEGKMLGKAWGCKGYKQLTLMKNEDWHKWTSKMYKRDSRNKVTVIY